MACMIVEPKRGRLYPMPFPASGTVHAGTGPVIGVLEQGMCWWKRKFFGKTIKEPIATLEWVVFFNKVPPGSYTFRLYKARGGDVLGQVRNVQVGGTYGVGITWPAINGGNHCALYFPATGTLTPNDTSVTVTLKLGTGGQPIPSQAPAYDGENGWIALFDPLGESNGDTYTLNVQGNVSGPGPPRTGLHIRNEFCTE